MLRNGSREWLIGWGDSEWASAYTENPEGRLESYCYHLFDSRRAHGARPTGAAGVVNPSLHFNHGSQTRTNANTPGF